ncbi:MAG TPA: hypothetical protein VLW65_13635 [Bryobacteraceae bacterium]|nr:hypothetical protein [Bryobacteraceae bacterium]
MRKAQVYNQRLRTTPIECVVLTAFDCEFAFLRNICGRVGIRLHHASTLEQADFLLMATEAGVLVSDAAGVDCSWRGALDLIGARYPLVAMLVVADPLDAPFVEDACRLGVCGVLWKPVRLDAASRLIRTAYQAWEDRLLLREESGIAACPGR